MTASPPASSLISPDLRRRLQQNYEEAQRLAGSKSPDRTRIHELLAECLRSDPGSILYLDALVANARQMAPRQPSWVSRWLPWPVRTQSSLSKNDSILRRAPEILSSNPIDLAELAQLAEAAAASELDQAELRYWQLAVEIAPENAEFLRGYAQTLTWQGRFADAENAWRKLLTTVPHDPAALQALADLNPAGESIETQFAETEHTLSEQQAAGAPLLDILARREQLQINRSQARLEIAQRRATSDSHPRAQALVARLEAEHNHVEAEILHLRCERLPHNWQSRVALARALKRSGNFSGAIQRLEEAARLCTDEPTILLELGECWQHLRQFPKALDFFRQAIAAAERANTELAKSILQLARYRAAVLAQALGFREEARTYLTSLIAADSSYKDAKQRLDNLESN